MLGGGKYRGPSRIRWLLIGLVIGFLLGMIIATDGIGIMDVVMNPARITEILPA